MVLGKEPVPAGALGRLQMGNASRSLLWLINILSCLLLCDHFWNPSLVMSIISPNIV